jgi:putative transposase
VVFNEALAARQAAYAAGEPYLSDAVMSAALTASKRAPERAWLAGVSSVVLQQALADLNAAYRNFFDSVSGKRKGPKVCPPRFRSRKDSRQAIRFTANARFRMLPNGRLRLPKVGDVEVRWSRELPAGPSSVTVIRDSAGRFFASFVVEVTPQPLPETGAGCGIDLGLGHFAVLDDGTKVSAPRFLRRAEKKLKQAQRDLSRKQEGSRNRDKARVHKAKLYGREFRKIGRLEPTSQVCSACGVKDGPKPLAVREWTCKECRTVHDRDVNAAKNIAALGRREALNARGGQVRPVATLAHAVESGSHGDAA